MIIAVDTREQLQFTFDHLAADAQDGGGPLAVATARVTLASGDYSLVGYESAIAIERKSAADLFGTIGSGRARFERELARLSAMPFALVVVEASWADVIERPPDYTRLTPKTVVRSVIAWRQRFPAVHWDFCGSRRMAEVMTYRTLERFWRVKQLEAKEAGLL